MSAVLPIPEFRSVPDSHPIMSKNNRSADRFLGMGFRLLNVSLERCDLIQGYSLRGAFRCVCGREEQFQKLFFPEEERFINVYDQIEGFGALSRDHLLDDGYTAQEIDAMEARLRTFKRGDA